MILHAYRRTAPHEVEVSGQVLKFAANEHGHQVCYAAPGPATDRLLELTEGYVVYGPAEESKPLTQTSKYLLVSGEQTLDLAAMSRDALLAFIAEQGIDYKPRANTPDDNIRDRILAAINEGA